MKSGWIADVRTMVVTASIVATVAACAAPASAQSVSCLVEVSVDEMVSFTTMDVTLERGTAMGAFSPRSGNVGDSACRILAVAPTARLRITASADSATLAGTVRRDPAVVQGPLFECDFAPDPTAALPTAADFVVTATAPVASYSISPVVCATVTSTTTTTTTTTTTVVPTSSSTTTTLPGAVACGQPVTTGAGPTATDCLFILSVAVGITSCVPDCACDVNGDSNATATDALTCLNIAVGVDLPLDCPCGSTTSTTLSSQLGACCLDQGGCVILSRADCTGTYLGDSDNSTCTIADTVMCALQQPFQRTAP